MFSPAMLSPAAHDAGDSGRFYDSCITMPKPSMIFMPTRGSSRPASRHRNALRCSSTLFASIEMFQMVSTMIGLHHADDFDSSRRHSEWDCRRLISFSVSITRPARLDDGIS